MGAALFRKEKMRKFLIFLALGAITLSPFSAIAEYSAGSAKSYLLEHANNPWSTMALAALGENSIPQDYLKSVSGSTAIEYAAPILAITALKQDPRSFGDKDYVAELEKYHNGGQIGDPSAINDDIFGLLALVSAGGQSSIIGDAKNFILAHQQANGGWGYAASGGADSNMTSAAVVALIAGGVPAADGRIQKAFDYLKTAQNDDGGFTYEPGSQFGTASDSSSTAWALWALRAAGANPADWSKSGNSPIQYLESNQTSSGYFKFQSDSAEDAFSSVTTAYAVIALAGKTLPLNIVSTSAAKFQFRIEGKDSAVCAGEVPGPTALDVVKNASALCGFAYHIQSTSFGPYLDQIGEDKAAGAIGWMYLVNWLSPSVGAGSYNLKSGDSVLWYYGDFNWKPARLALSETQIASGGSSAAAVEYFENGLWSPLEGAGVIYGVQVVVTGGDGKVSITPPDGYYKVSAEKAGYIRTNGIILKVGSPAGNQVGLSAVIRKGEVKGSSISFTVDPSAIDFGALAPGERSSRNLSIKNTGTVNISVRGIVSGDDVFVSNLSLNGGSWPGFQKFVAIDQTQTLSAALAIPANYSGSEGGKTGAITFWAVAE